MHNTNVRILHHMLRVGWVLPWWIVLNINTRKLSLLFGEYIILILYVVFPVLIQNTIEGCVRNVLNRQFSYIVTKGKCFTAPDVAVRLLSVNRNVYLEISLREVIQV